MSHQRVIVIGAGIAGLTAAALLSKEGIPVTLLESHYQTGGCAGTFARGSFVFDAGATQVAGLEEGGIHERLFRHLNISRPKAHLLDLACLVDLADGYEPIKIWHDPIKWAAERKKHFPGSESFWKLLEFIHQTNWNFSSRDPILPVRNTWDFIQLLKAIRPVNAISGLLSRSSIADLLALCGCSDDCRLRHFLDLQLKLYSQESANRTAALYGATVLHMAQAPLGLWHLDGSMQKLSDLLEKAVISRGGTIYLQHRVLGLEKQVDNQTWKLKVMRSSGESIEMIASDVIFTLPPQSLTHLLVQNTFSIKSYIQYLNNLPKPSSAIVFYGALRRSFLPKGCPDHIQLSLKDPGNLFISISREGDGRAPIGFATVISSCFTNVSDWSTLSRESYKHRKNTLLLSFARALEDWLQLPAGQWEHQEIATPRSFAKWTGRPEGIVGGLGQHPSRFGPFGLASRTPISGLWLCGDSIYPGEGTAGVTYSAVMACRQLMANRGQELAISL